MSKKKQTVAILGGGMGGLFAAHELCRSGNFDITVYEQEEFFGGKAKSTSVEKPLPPPWDPERVVDQVLPDNKPLPGEHGFRLFPGFYNHCTDTFKKIPCPPPGGTGQSSCVIKNLTPLTEAVFASETKKPISLPLAPPIFKFWKWFDLKKEYLRLFGPDSELGLPEKDVRFLERRVWQLLTTSPERQLAEYESLSWQEYHETDNRSESYIKHFVEGITRSLVAARADKASTFTDGKIFVQIFFDMMDPRRQADRVFHGPTNEAWLNPWIDWMKSKGVKFQNHASLVSVHTNKEKEKAEAADLVIDGKPTKIEADYFVFALPLELVLQHIGSKSLVVDPTLNQLKKLDDHVDWMVGMQIYLTEDVTLGAGHIIYVDSQWAITAVSQRQFWDPAYDLSNYGDGTVKGVISLVLSDWFKEEGDLKPASQCTKEEIFTGVWEHLKVCHNHGEDILRDEMVHSWNLDPAIQFDPATNTPYPRRQTELEKFQDVILGKKPPAHPPGNKEPLLINEVNTWTYRPESYTRIRNLFLASDYVRTNTDLATMEAANEAGRRAANGIMNPRGYDFCGPKVWKLNNPILFRVFRSNDTRRFRRGLPWRTNGWRDLTNPVFLFFLLLHILYFVPLVIWTSIRNLWRVKTTKRAIKKRSRIYEQSMKATDAT